MKKVIGAFLIMAIIESGFTGDEELKNRDENVHKPSGSSFIQLPDLNHTILDAYHTTDPYSRGHDKRMAEKLRDSEPRSLRRRAIHLMSNLCAEWYRITGFDMEGTRDLFNEIYSRLNTTDGPDTESQMRNKLLEIRSELRTMDPEIIRSIVHEWYKSIKKEGKIRSREDEADLLYTSHQVRSGDGHVHERLAQKWKQFRPHLSDYNKKTLINKANELSRVHAQFNSYDMEAAKKRYESVFGPGSGKPIKSTTKVARIGRIRSKEEEADLLYTYHQVLFGKGHVDNRLAEKWKQLHPHLCKYTKSSLLKKAQRLLHDHPGISSEEIKAARVRYESVFGPGSGKDPEEVAFRKRTSWTDELTVDLLYLTILCKKKKINSEIFQSYWRKMHPELALLNKKTLENRKSSLRRRRDKEELTPEEGLAAKARLEAALARDKESHQNQTLDEQVGLSTSESFHGQELHQQSSDLMIHSSPLPNSLQLTQEELNDMELWMNDVKTNHPPTPRYSPWSFHHGSFSHTVLSPFPDETSHSSFGLFANPYYEHGSSSHSHYVPDNINSYYERGNSSHPDDHPHPQ